MQNAATQEDIDIFASDPTGDKEIPGSPYYTDGVDVGYTAPALWAVRKEVILFHSQFHHLAGAV